MAQKRALLIGVGTYGEGLAPIPSALRDVDALAELLRAPELGGFEPEAVRVLKDPGRTEMETAVEGLFANRAPDDLLLLYFSGHGLRDEKRQLFLACKETSKIQEGPARGRLRQATALRARTLQEYMQASPSQRQLVILDCCFSGAMAIGMTVKDEGRIDLAEALGGEGRAILTSSAATELSQAGETVEGDSSGSGEGLSAYTRFLVEGISTGAADRRQRGFVDAEDLHDYVKRRLGEVNPAQTPEFYPTRTGYSIVVSRLPRDPSVEYRKQLQKLAEERRGAISPAGRLLLDDLLRELGLPQPEAERIEVEVLQPFRDYDDKLCRYRQALEAMVAALPEPGSQLHPVDQEELSELESRFKLRGSDVETLHRRLGIRLQEQESGNNATEGMAARGKDQPGSAPTASRDAAGLSVVQQLHSSSPPLGGQRLGVGKLLPSNRTTPIDGWLESERQQADENQKEKERGKSRLPLWRRAPRRSTAAAVTGLVALPLVAGWLMRFRHPDPSTHVPAGQQSRPPTHPNAIPTSTPPAPASAITPLTTSVPSEAELSSLLESWFSAKANVLRGGPAPGSLNRLARQSMIDQLEQERRFHQARGEVQQINANVKSLVIEERSPSRITAKAQIKYSDITLNGEGMEIYRIPDTLLNNGYVFGRDDGIWRLVGASRFD